MPPVLLAKIGENGDQNMLFSIAMVFTVIVIIVFCSLEKSGIAGTESEKESYEKKDAEADKKDEDMEVSGAARP
jgi:hypothetical protein